MIKINTSILNIIKKVNISSLARNTGNTLNVIKKIIPVYREIKPYVSKEKTIFQKNINNNQIETKSIKQENIDNSITFFN